MFPFTDKSDGMDDIVRFYASLNRLLIELDVEPPAAGTKFEYCIPVIEKAIEEVKTLKKIAGM